MSLPTLNLIGPGRLARSLAYLWQQAGVLHIQDIVGRDPVHCQEAAAFIDAGKVCTLTAIRPADFTLVATPDDALVSTAEMFAATGMVRTGDVIFHCSGALASTVLTPLKTAGALIGSVHPLASFANPAVAVKQFDGTYCGCEGDRVAIERLAPLFDAIGARRFMIDPAQKTLYHAGAVLACNNLVALMETALRCMAAAGITRDTAWQALRPLVVGTLNNLDKLPAAEALTGPIARGDAATVASQMAATSALDAKVAASYHSLGLVALELAAARPIEQGGLTSKQLAALEQALRPKP
ncbi:Rossmann-like and DUF2520 domain-containing protein [Chitinimonas sp. PSY-7]|uniref:DUF2520 domain-containing protein n=1 Tax=Chitinimonas sp. PSY-7 TaxID=3459088 RepID=UPI0040402959